jgi:hypothetical protein
MGGKSTFIRQVLIFCTILLVKLITVVCLIINYQTLSFYFYDVKHGMTIKLGCIAFLCLDILVHVYNSDTCILAI